MQYARSLGPSGQQLEKEYGCRSRLIVFASSTFQLALLSLLLWGMERSTPLWALPPSILSSRNLPLCSFRSFGLWQVPRITM